MFVFSVTFSCLEKWCTKGCCYFLSNYVLHVVELATRLQHPLHLRQCPIKCKIVVAYLSCDYLETHLI